MKRMTKPHQFPLPFHLHIFLLLLLIASSRASLAQPTGDDATTTTDTVTTTTPLSLFPPTSGPLEDLACNIEDLEKANDSQLHVILSDLVQTSFFRNFVVDLHHQCPLSSWHYSSSSFSRPTTKKPPPSSSSSSSSSIVGEDQREGMIEEAAKEIQPEDEFECAGGGDDLDDDAQPLCTVDGMGNNENDDPASFLSSNALSSLSQTGFQSKAQKDTFSWKQQTDPVIQDDNDPTAACGNNGDDQDSLLLPDSFWMDMCSNIHAGDGTTVVNLALNPEHNTYYNGTHIWKAIYEENCINFDDNNAAMCLEERVLYRLLSGLHTSTTLSIATKYDPPSKRKNRTDWQPNPDYFMQKFQHDPEHLRNLHFSYVVLLRALQKASPYLRQYEIRTGDIVQDETAQTLLTRLLDSTILQSCSHVFSAFDESLMFAQDSDNVVALQKNFKGVFHNVSSILDCVQCQQCKLHGKMVMLGYGTALKILFMRGSNPMLTRNELVALINTIAKFSESLTQVRELTHLYWESQNAKLRTLQESVAGTVTDVRDGSISTMTLVGGGDPGLVDAAVGAVAALGQAGYIDWQQEANLIEQAFQKNAELLILAKHYGRDVTKFANLVQRVVRSTDTAAITVAPDAIVVGSGLAGLTASLNILDRGGRVTIIEKEHLLGGNSNKASSGINACCPQENYTDTLELFINDTIRSAGKSARPDLIQVLVENSANAVGWLKDRVGVDLSLTAQLGGHSSIRTHRPSNGMAGAEIIYGMQKAVRAYEKMGRAKILIDTKVQKLLTKEDGTVVGVRIVKNHDGDGTTDELRAPNVILATGGFAADRSSGSYLEQYRPELLKMPTTAGGFSTGDGVALATTLGAGTVDMDKVQIHPTGWVDPADPDNTSKILAAELLRGVGGLLMNSQGERFCNELGTRSYVTKKMLSHDPNFAKTGKWEIESSIPVFSLVLSSSAAADAKKHIDLYSHKGLLTRLEGVAALANWMGIPKSIVVATLKGYQTAASKGVDSFGKKTFRGVPAVDLDEEVFYAGMVTPVLHYCMGGITIDKEGNVLKEDGEPIPGLHAAGEVSGGVHGANRLAGNSLLECTVFGTIVGKKIPIQSPVRESYPEKTTSDRETTEPSNRKVSSAELREHNTAEDCWVAIHGFVYDLTDFADEHPAGAESIHELAGQDGTEAFAAVHNEKMLEDFIDERVGVYSS